MRIDGFKDRDREAFVAFRPRWAAGFYGVTAWVGQRLDVQVDGIERIPPGCAVLVANHAFGFDVAFAAAAIWKRSGRTVWVLGEHLWWRIPFVRRVAAAIGVVDGTQENMDKLLSKGELVLVLPGGLREAVKPRELRYRLLWGDRYGFVRAAIRSHAPLLPLASIGADEWLDLEGDAYLRGKRWFGLSGIPLPRFSRVLPIPHLVPLRLVVGEAIEAPAGVDLAQDSRTVFRLRREVEGGLQELIDRELARRAGIELGTARP